MADKRRPRKMRMRLRHGLTQKQSSIYAKRLTVNNWRNLKHNRFKYLNWYDNIKTRINVENN